MKMEVFDITAKDLISKIPSSETIKKIKRIVNAYSKKLGLIRKEKEELWHDLYALYSIIKQKSYLKLEKLRPKGRISQKRKQILEEKMNAAVYEAARIYVQGNKLTHEPTKVMYMYEKRRKHEEIFGQEGILSAAIEDSKSIRAYSPFFLASAHPNPAKDHADWEGKLYYDEKWEDYVPESDPNYARIKALIQNRHLYSVQWVTGPSVYLCTRRNCKHFFKNIPLREAMGASPKSLLKKNKMFMKDEIPASKQILYYRSYYNRVKVEESLMEIIPNEKLQQDLQNDKLLLDKWKALI